MTKAVLQSVIAKEAALTGEVAHRVVNVLIEHITTELKKNGKFLIPSFGSFRVAQTKARKGFNPRTGDIIKVKAKRKVRFKASPKLDEKMKPGRK